MMRSVFRTGLATVLAALLAGSERVEVLVTP